MLIKVHANLGYFWVLSSWKFVTWLPNNEINQNITLYSCFWHYSFFHILNLGYFGLYLAIFGYPGFLPIFHSYLKLKYIKLEHFKPILGFQFSPEFHFSPIWVIFGFLWPFLGTQHWNTSRCIILHLFWVLQLSPQSYLIPYRPIGAILGCFWLFLGTPGYQYFHHSYLTLIYI